MYWSTIVIKPLRPGVTAEQVGQASGYNPRLVDIRRNEAWIEITNDGRETEHRDRAFGRCQLAGLIAE